MSMWPEPDIEDVSIDDGSGRYWRHVKTCIGRIELSETMGLQIAEIAEFLLFDPHETEGFFVLRTRDHKPVCVLKTSGQDIDDVRGHYDRPATEEEWSLAEKVARALGCEVMKQANFVVDDEPEGGMKP